MSSPPPRKRVRQRSSVVTSTEPSEMFDEVPPSSAPAAASAAPNTRATRGRMRMQKNKKNTANNSQNGHNKTTANNAVQQEKSKAAEAASDNSSTSDLEDALGSPNECTAALVRKVRRKSGLGFFDQELMRIVGQHLIDIGLQTSAQVLMAEAGTQLIHPTAANFRKLVLNGEWTRAVKTLEDLKNHLENPDSLVEMKFLLLEQKFLEMISKGNTMNALKVLQGELSALKHNQPRVHELSTFLMLSDPEEIAKNTRSHQGSKATDQQARLDLMHRLQAYIPASMMLPPKRLMTLLDQSAEFQTDRCLRHSLQSSGTVLPAPLDPSYLTKDHKCEDEDFPCETIQVLTDHYEEVLYCKFSPNGLKLATGGKDKTVNIYDFDPQTLTLKLVQSLDRHSHYVVFFAWSPDSTKLAVCIEDCEEVFVWNVETGSLDFKISHAADESLTTVAWSPDGQKIACGGIRGQFYQCDALGTILDHKEGVRVQALAYRKDSRTILAADTHHRIRSYVLDEEATDRTVLQEGHGSHGIMGFTIDETDRYALLNVASQGLHLWSIEDKCLVRRYTGVKQGDCIIHSCFGGGADNTFIASGSQDHKVYIYHWQRETPIAELTGHLRSVNCVSWNPVYPKVVVSASDDSTLRVWGPVSKFRQQNASNGASSSSVNNVKNGHDVLLDDDNFHNGLI